MNEATREVRSSNGRARGQTLLARGKFKSFAPCCRSTPTTAYGEGNMHDTVMLLGMLGWDHHDGKVEFITDLFQLRY